jgi:hypothetical protein
MTPQQITDALNNITSIIADAQIQIRKLEKSFEAASTQNQSVDVVYLDIWIDAGLGGIYKALRNMENQIADAQGIFLTEHFERLRKGEP